MKSLIMINKYDSHSFDKGDIISVQPESGSFGVKINNNVKFKTVLVDGISVSDISMVLEPLSVYAESEELYNIIKSRKFYIDVDVINDDEVSLDLFMSLLSVKSALEVEQIEDVVV